MARGKNAGNKGQGSKWIPKKRRAAIYERDGHRCVWCSATERLSLDHLVPRSRGGSNESSNLVTSCVGCNRHRCNKATLVYAVELSARLDEAPLSIVERLYQQAERAA
jgi:5-methylcytosine-specific restriction endonuclease McrA